MIDIKGILDPNSKFLTNLRLKKADDPIFSSSSLNHILEEKWKIYARKIFWNDAKTFGCFFLAFVVYAGIVFPLTLNLIQEQ